MWTYKIKSVEKLGNGDAAAVLIFTHEDGRIVDDFYTGGMQDPFNNLRSIASDKIADLVSKDDLAQKQVIFAQAVDEFVSSVVIGEALPEPEVEVTIEQQLMQKKSELIMAKQDLDLKLIEPEDYDAKLNEFKALKVELNNASDDITP